MSSKPRNILILGGYRTFGGRLAGAERARRYRVGGVAEASTNGYESATAPSSCVAW